MAGGSARPGPHDGSGPLVWIIGGVCVALIGLIIRMSFASWDHGQAFTYVLVGGVVGFLLHLLRRRSRKGQR
jgi:D-alanyl-lipoteichoic acid acyltransferase DltB (MBOAT superfamily)